MKPNILNALMCVYPTLKSTDPTTNRDKFISRALQFGKNMEVSFRDIETVLDTPIKQLANLKNEI